MFLITVPIVKNSHKFEYLDTKIRLNEKMAKAVNM